MELRFAQQHRRMVMIVSIIALILTTVGLAMLQSAAAAHDDPVPDGDVSALVAAISHANSGGGTVTLTAAGEYVLTTVNNGDNGLPLITGEVTIEGNDATIRRSDEDGTPEFRIFEIAADGELTLNEVTISGGRPPDSGDGGGIHNAGSLTLTNSIVSDNFSAGYGGGIYNAGSFDLDRSTVSDNSSFGGGGGIYNSGSSSLYSCTISGNWTSSLGGGIHTQGSANRVTSTACTITGNTSLSPGGGIDISDGSGVTMFNSFVSNNQTNAIGGGIHISGSSELGLYGSTVSGNQANSGGGVYNTGSSAWLALTNNTITGNEATASGAGIYIASEATLTNNTITGNEANSNGGGIYTTSSMTMISNTITENKANSSGGGMYGTDSATFNLTASIVAANEGGNISGSGSLNQAYSLIDGNPLLGPLQNNGWRIESMMPLPGSPAIDAIPLNNGECEAGSRLDQRHFQRPYGSGCDIGAIEFTPPPVLTLPDDFTVDYDQRTSVTWSAIATDWADESIPVTCTPSSGSSFPVGQTTVHCEATDLHNQSASGSFVVTVMASTSIDFTPVDGPDNPWFWATWARTDLPVRDGHVSRTWMWGPGPFTGSIWEPYTTELQNPGGDPVFLSELPETVRELIYFDKARMEINDPDGDTDSLWYVTNGLLVIEMITGNRQFGDDLFKHYAPSTSNIAGDADGTTGPTYAALQNVLDRPAQPVGSVVNEEIASDGSVSQNAARAEAGITIGHVDGVTGHGIAGPFWTFMQSEGLVYEDGSLNEDALFENPFYATGRPVTGAYWTTVPVAGASRDVLLQCFERRCLTYTPGNSEGFVVEAGNVGQHYYEWRYVQAPD